MKHIEKEYMTALQITMDICQILLENGADVSKVEEMAQRLCVAMEMKEISIIVLPSFISITYLDDRKQKHTASRRCQEMGINLGKIEGASCLIDDIEKRRISIDGVCQKINRLQKAKKEIWWKRLLIYWGVASIFTLIFMGADIQWFVQKGLANSGAVQGVTLSLIDLGAHLIITTICSTMVYGIDQLLARARISDVFGKMISTAGIVGTLWVGNMLVESLAGMEIVDLSIYPMYILMGNIMLVVPGVKFTNGIKDLFSGDTASAIIRVTEAVFSTLGIAIGVLLMQGILSVELSAIDPPTMLSRSGTMYQCFSILLAGFGTMFFSFYFRIDQSHKWLSFFAGAMTWSVYVLVLRMIPAKSVDPALSQLTYIPECLANLLERYGMHAVETVRDNGIGSYMECFLPNFCAAAFATIISELISSQKKTPTMMFLFPAIVALIPGGLLYKAMYALLSATSMEGNRLVYETLYTAGGISCGVFVVAAFSKIILSIVESIDAKTAGDKSRSEVMKRVAQDEETADNYYNIARRYDSIDVGCAYAFYQAAAAAYDSAIEDVEQCDWERKYEVYKKAGINRFWIYKCMMKTDEDKNVQHACLAAAKEHYTKAQDALSGTVGRGENPTEVLRKRAVLWNWLAVMEINEARHAEGEDCDIHLSNANEYLEFALQRYPEYDRIHINVAEVAFCRTAQILGIQYEHPISMAIHTSNPPRNLSNTPIMKYLDVIEKHLEYARLYQTDLNNVYYKFAQLNTYRVCYYHFLGKDEKSIEIQEARKGAEEWLRVASMRGQQSMGFLYVYREYLEITDIDKACEVNEIIRKRDKLAATRWEKDLKQIGII